MSNNTKNVSVNFPLFGILGLIFITLKLTGHITWSWLWVLAPFWISFAIAVIAILFIFLFAIFAKK